MSLDEEQRPRWLLIRDLARTPREPPPRQRNQIRCNSSPRSATTDVLELMMTVTLAKRLELKADESRALLWCRHAPNLGTSLDDAARDAADDPGKAPRRARPV
jgi:hypothetical protein